MKYVKVAAIATIAFPLVFAERVCGDRSVRSLPQERRIESGVFAQSFYHQGLNHSKNHENCDRPDVKGTVASCCELVKMRDALEKSGLAFEGYDFVVVKSPVASRYEPMEMRDLLKKSGLAVILVSGIDILAMDNGIGRMDDGAKQSVGILGGVNANVLKANPNGEDPRSPDDMQSTDPVRGRDGSWNPETSGVVAGEEERDDRERRAGGVVEDVVMGGGDGDAGPNVVKAEVGVPRNAETAGLTAREEGEKARRVGPDSTSAMPTIHDNQTRLPDDRVNPLSSGERANPLSHGETDMQGVAEPSGRDFGIDDEDELNELWWGEVVYKHGQMHADNLRAIFNDLGVGHKDVLIITCARYLAESIGPDTKKMNVRDLEGSGDGVYCLIAVPGALCVMLCDDTGAPAVCAYLRLEELRSQSRNRVYRYGKPRSSHFASVFESPVIDGELDAKISVSGDKLLEQGGADERVGKVDKPVRRPTAEEIEKRMT